MLKVSLHLNDTDFLITSYSFLSAWLRTVRAFMSLAIVSLLVAFGYIIATFIRSDLVPNFAGVMGIVTGR